MLKLLLSAFAILALAAGSSFSREEAKPIHLFILSGQSNMQKLKPESSFLPEVRNLLSDDEVVHIKVAKGGQPIRLWVKEWNNIAAKHDIDVKVYSTPYYDRILAQFKVLDAKYPQGFSSISFNWMQGEQDAKEKLSVTYEESLKTLIANLRRDLRAPHMNVVIGRLSDSRVGKQPEWEKIREILMKVATDDKHGAWVDTDDLNNKVRKGRLVNTVHYTKEGYELLGQRFARQSVKLIKGEKPNPDGK